MALSATAILLCLVVGVTDGDTLTVRCDNQPQVKVRLTEIDAPEKRQAFGQRSKQALSDLVFGRKVALHVQEKDRYGRLLAQVNLGNLDVNFAMVSDGMAWCYEQYLVRTAACHKAQTEAKTAKRGLWVDPVPLAPWEFRKAQRENRTR